MTPAPRYRLVVIGLVLGVALAIAVALQDCGGSVQRRASGDVAAATE